MSQSTGCVYLIGAGCGQADLITLRGLELLRQCDAVVYDDLIADELLQAAPPQARRIYMGKRLGRHSAPQEEISQTLVELAKQGLRVARLKGGDPFVFGRGGAGSPGSRHPLPGGAWYFLLHRHSRPGRYPGDPPGDEPRFPRGHCPYRPGRSG